jgi:cytochrome c3-like protein
MEVEVTVLTRRGAAVMRRSQRASAPRVRLGRGTDNEVPLADIRVGLHAAVLSPRAGGMTIEKVGTSSLTVNGAVVDNASVGAGDEILLGPYRIEVLPPPEGCDGAIQIELMQPMGAALERVTSTARIGLEETGARKRVYAWTGTIVVILAALAAPLVIFAGKMAPQWHHDGSGALVPTVIGKIWDTGEFSNAHRFFSTDCATCHTNAFQRVADKACLSCHSKVGDHVEHGMPLGSVGDQLAALRCIACHTEHRGIAGSVVRDAGLCLDCHKNLAETVPAAGIKDVSGFPKGHPQFRATVVADAASKTTTRVDLGTNPPPVDRPGLKFSHAAHLVPGGFPALNYREMTCADCHVAEPSGQSFLPITYKGQCQRCHDLAFDKVALPWPDARVPHGDDRGVITGVWNYYAGLALQGVKDTPGAAATSPNERRAAGVPPAAGTPPSAQSMAWVTAKSEAALAVILDDKRGCAYCHFGTGPQGVFDSKKILADALPPKGDQPHFIAAVSLRTRFLPQAQFDHTQHRGVGCTDCHSSGEALTSGEILIPGIDTCVKCHGTENAELRAQSTCISCHVFHRSERGPMRMSQETRQ